MIPLAFWFFSIGGGVLLLGYALYRRDPVFIVGQAFGVFVYLRNLYFVLRDASRTAVESQSARENAEKPCSRSAIRSPVSSSPM